MIGRALYIAENMRLISRQFGTEYVKLIRILELTNSVRRAEESIRVCSFHSSAADRADYCAALKAADKAASAAASAGAFSAEFTGSDLLFGEDN